MNRNLIRRNLSIILVMALLLAGCGPIGPEQPEETAGQETVQSAQLPTETTDNGHRPGEETGFIHSYPLGTTVYYDLDGDGADDCITVNAQEYADGQLVVGNTSMEFMAINPTGYFTVVNVDESMNILMIGVSDYGFSDDDLTVLYAYDGERIVETGFFEDILGQNSYDKAGAVCHGDGTITARVRMDILGTWMALGLYRMGEAGLEDHTDLYRYMDWEGRITGWEVTANVPLVMYADSTQTAEQIAVPAGTPVRMTGVKRGQTDNTHWACFEVDSLGKTLWLLTEEIEWQTYVWTDDGLISSEEIFEGFFYAG